MGNFTQLVYGWILKQLMASFQKKFKPPEHHHKRSTTPTEQYILFLTQFQRTRPKNTQIKLNSFFFEDLY